MVFVAPLSESFVNVDILRMSSSIWGEGKRAKKFPQKMCVGFWPFIVRAQKAVEYYQTKVGIDNSTPRSPNKNFWKRGSFI